MATGKKTGGRQKGTPNKLSSGVKANVVGVFEKIGGREQMAKWARENQTEFYRLYARLLPTEVSGPDGGPIQAITREMPPEEAARAYKELTQRS